MNILLLYVNIYIVYLLCISYIAVCFASNVHVVLKSFCCSIVIDAVIHTVIVIIDVIRDGRQQSVSEYGVFYDCIRLSTIIYH